MSKSLNNVYLLKDIIEKGYDPIVYRLFCYSCHYRNKLNFTWEGIEATSKALVRLRKGYQNHLKEKSEISEDLIHDFEEKFNKAINDDLNMSAAMGVIWDVVKQEIKSYKWAELLLKFDSVLGLMIDKHIEEKDEVPEEIKVLVEQRKEARDKRDWVKSDELRDLIREKGYEVIDSKDGMEVNKL